MTWDLPDVYIDIAANIGDPDPWETIASSDDQKFQGCEYSQGTNRFEGVTGRYEAGRLTGLMIDDTSGDLDPTNLDGPYVVDGRSLIHPMRAIRFRAVYDEVYPPMFTGFIEGMPTTVVGTHFAQLIINAVDGTKVLANHDGLEQSPQGAGETTGARMHRLADDAGWPMELREFDTGISTVQATTLAQNTYTEMLLTADTELGELYFTGEGKLRFRERHAIITETRSTVSQATFSNVKADGVLPWQSVVLNDDDTQLRNLVRISRVGGTLQVAEDLVSQVRYSFDGVTPMPRTWGRNDLLMEDDDEALAYAQYVVYQSSDPELRFDSMVIDPSADPVNLFPQVLGRKLGDRITGVLHRPDGRIITRDVFIRGIRHMLSTGRWLTEWSLQDAGKFSFFVLDHDVLGLLDFNALGH